MYVSLSRSGGEVPAREGDPTVRKVNAAKLAAGYTKRKRFLECCYLVASGYLWFSHFIIVGRYFVFSDDANVRQIIWMPLIIVAAMALADFISGFAHWGLDTWGSPETPLFGNFIRSFREHHVNQSAMCKHDFIETNADTTLPLLPFLLLQRFFLTHPNLHGNNYSFNVYTGNVGYHVFALTLFLLIAITNEIHKWAHMMKQAPLVRRAMDLGILLSPLVHRKHHKDPFDRCYCITTGWMNRPLDAIGFWRHLENLITATTGAVPRANDQTLLGK